MPGKHLYIIQSHFTGAVKIGRSDQPDERLKQLQTGSPYPLRLLAVLDGQGCKELHVHRLVERFRIRRDVKGEWFHHDCLPDLPEWVYERLPFEDRWWQKKSAG